MASDEQIVDMLVSVQTQYVPKSEIASLTAENARLAGQVAALREALAGILESYEFCLGDELALSDLTKAVMRGGVHRRAGAGTRSPGGGGRGGAGVSGTGQGGPV